MHKKRFWSDELLKEVFKVFILMGINIVMNKNVYSHQDMLNKVTDILVIILVWLLYLIIFSISKIKSKPINIEVKIKNKLTNKNETEIAHGEGNRGRQDRKTVVLELNIIKNNSFWIKLALFILKNKDIDLFLGIVPSINEFCCVPTVYSSDIERCQDYYIVKTKDVIISTCENNAEYSKIYEFIIDENRDNPPQHNCKFNVKADIKLDENSLHFPYNLLINYNKKIVDKLHKVNFYK